MANSLKHLVNDLRKTIESGESSPSAKDMKMFLAEIEEAVGSLFRRDSRKGDGGKLRFSSLGRKNRQLWYQSNRTRSSENETLPYDTKLKFTYGHIIESLLLLIVKTAGNYKVTDTQKEYIIDSVKGHIDAKINGHVVDCKSASSYGFRKFKKGDLSDDPFGYMQQIGAYMEADGEKDEGGFLVLNKESGEICYMSVHSLELPSAQERITEVKEIIKQEEPPEKCYTTSRTKQGREYLKTGCVYCDFKEECWENTNQGFGLVVETGTDGRTRYFTNTLGPPL